MSFGSIESYFLEICACEIKIRNQNNNKSACDCESRESVENF